MAVGFQQGRDMLVNHSTVINSNILKRVLLSVLVLCLQAAAKLSAAYGMPPPGAAPAAAAPIAAVSYADGWLGHVYRCIRGIIYLTLHLVLHA
jgi:hypothetical protein